MLLGRIVYGEWGIGDLWYELSSDGRDVICIDTVENCEIGVECERVREA